MSKFNMPKLYKHNSFQQMLNEQFQDTGKPNLKAINVKLNDDLRSQNKDWRM